MLQKKIFLILSVALLLLAVWFGADIKPNITTDQNPDINIAYENVKKSSVLVECGSFMGSGNIYDISDHEICAITAGHVVTDQVTSGSGIQVTFYDGKKADAELFSIDTENDTALLGIKKADIESNDYVSINVSETLPSTEESIFFIDAMTGTANAGIVEKPQIYLSDFSTDMILCQCSVTPGMSGTGLFDGYGNYLGILLGGQSDDASSGDDQSTTDMQRAACLPSSDIIFKRP